MKHFIVTNWLVLSCLKREKSLANLADLFKIDSYDGWDAGNIDPTKPLSK
jgi:hypothetical protein